jgi:hypothetical protein
MPAVTRRAARGFAWGVLAAISLFLLWSRFTRLNTSLWNDEAYTAMTFIDRGPNTMFTGHYDPNNHLLFSLVTWATTNLFGYSETAYRIGSVVPAIAAVGLAASWARRRLRPIAAAIVIVLATMSSVHLVLAPQARGYGIGFLAGAGVLMAAVGVNDRGRVRDFVQLGIFGALGIWTLPQFAVTFVAQAGVLFVIRSDLRRRIVATTVIVAVASVAFYALVLDQLLRTSQYDYGLPKLPWSSWINGPYSHLGKPTLAPFLPDPLTRGPWLVLLFLGLAALGVRWLVRRGERALLLLIVAPPIAVYVVLVVARVGFASRYTSYLLFHVIVLLALGIAEAWDLMQPRALRAVIAAVSVGLVAVAAHNTIEHTRTLPYENAKRVKQIVDASGKESYVFTNSTRPFALQYYVGRKRLTTKAGLASSGFLPRPQWQGWAEGQFCERPPPFVYIDHESPLADDPGVDCLVDRGAIHTFVGPSIRGSMDVWVLDR